MIGTIILIIIVAVIVYYLTKYIVEQKNWGQKKAELEKDFEVIKSDLEKQVLEKEKEHEKSLKEISIEQEKKITLLKEKFLELIKGHRKDAIKRSKHTLMGRLWETIAPYIPNFKHNPADMKFIGSPIDYIVFKGMNEKDIKKIVFLEVKSGSSKLNAQEKKLKKAIENGKVEWEEFRLDDIVSDKKIDDKILEKDLKKELKEIEEDIKEAEEI